MNQPISWLSLCSLPGEIQKFIQEAQIDVTSLLLGYLVILIRNQWWCSSWRKRIKWFSLKQYQWQHHHYCHHHLHMRSPSRCASWKISLRVANLRLSLDLWPGANCKHGGWANSHPVKSPILALQIGACLWLAGGFTNQNLGNWIWEVYSWVYHWFRYPQHELRYGKAIWFIIYVLKLLNHFVGDRMSDLRHYE